MLCMQGPHVQDLVRRFAEAGSDKVVREVLNFGASNHDVPNCLILGSAEIGRKV